MISGVEIDLEMRHLRKVATEATARAEKDRKDASVAIRECKRQVELCGVIGSRQADAVKKLSAENVTP